MNGMGQPGKQGGNPFLLGLVVTMLVVLVGLSLLGFTRSASVDQLLAAAAPDSSAFRADSLLQTAETKPEQIEEEPAPSPAPEGPKVDSSLDTEATNPALPVDSGKSTQAAPMGQGAVDGTGGEQVVNYTIRKGDTMYKIAALFGNKPADLVSLNGLPDMNVQAGKTLKVKIKGVHAVQDGEGLLAIGEKYGVAVKSIRLANNLSGDGVASGTRLIIPLK
jgi:LysM repeat protein